MPIYEFECGECGARFEMLRSISDSDGEVMCSECGGERPRMVYSVYVPRYAGGQPMTWGPT